MEILSLGCWSESLVRIEDLMQTLADRQAHSIKQLHLATIKSSEAPSIATPPSHLDSQSFRPFTFLHTLSIDSTYLTNELLQCFLQQATPLKQSVDICRGN